MKLSMHCAIALRSFALWRVSPSKFKTAWLKSQMQFRRMQYTGEKSTVPIIYSAECKKISLGIAMLHCHDCPMSMSKYHTNDDEDFGHHNGVN